MKLTRVTRVEEVTEIEIEMHSFEVGQLNANETTNEIDCKQDN